MMNLAANCFVWAQATSVDLAADVVDDSDWSQVLTYAVLVGLAISVVFLLLYLWERRHRLMLAAAAVDRRTLFQQMCDAHHLDSADAERLQLQAKQLQLADELLVFIDPRILETQAAGGGPGAARDRLLGERLFGAVFESRTR